MADESKSGCAGVVLVLAGFGWVSLKVALILAGLCLLLS